MGDIEQRQFYTLVATIVGTGVAAIDGTAVNVALPVLQHDLHATFAQTQWVIESYALFFSALILLGGSLGDIYGHRMIYGVGIGIFAFASLLCALAPNLDVLIAARCLQGVGGALLTPESLALLSATFSGEERGKAIGTWSVLATVTAAVGPVLGGTLVQYASWRYVFLINLPLAAFVIVLLVRYVAESRDPDAKRGVDIAGAAVATVGLGSLTYGLIDIQQRTTTLGLSAIAAGAALLVGFVALERRSRDAMMPPEMFRSRMFSMINAYTFLLYGALTGGLYFVPFELINVQHYPPALAGAALLPFIGIVFVFGRFTGGLAVRIGPRLPLSLGALLAGLGFLVYGLAGVGSSYWLTFFPGSVILGMGGALFLAPLATTEMDSVSAAHAGIASGVNNAVSRVGGLIAVAALGIVVAAGAARGGYTTGFMEAMFVSAGICAAAGALALDRSFRKRPA